MERIRELLNNKKGATSVEYALMLVLILIVVYVGYQQLGNTVNSKATEAESKLSN